MRNLKILRIGQNTAKILNEIKKLQPSKWLNRIQYGAAIATIITLAFLIINLVQVNKQIKLQIENQEGMDTTINMMNKQLELQRDANEGMENTINIMSEQIELQRGANKLMEDLVLNMIENKSFEMSKYEEEKKKHYEENKPDIMIDKVDPKADSNKVMIYITFKNRGKSTATQVTTYYECLDIITKHLIYKDSSTIADIYHEKPLVSGFIILPGSYIAKILVTWHWDYINKDYTAVFYRSIDYDAATNSYGSKSLSEERIKHYWPDYKGN